MDRTGAQFGRAAPPAPLIWPTVGVIGGIWLADICGEVAWRYVCTVVALAAVFTATLVWRSLRRTAFSTGHARGASRLNYATIVLVAASAGFVRMQLDLQRPAHHIARCLSSEATLTRVAGRIVAAPLERPPERRNPFLPADPQPRTQFVLTLEELRTGAAPQPACGTLRVSVKAAGLGLRLGQRVELAGTLRSPPAPRNPGETDWGAWYRRSSLDGSLSVPGGAYLRILPEPVGWWAALVTRLRAVAEASLLEPGADEDTEAATRLLDVMVLGQRSLADRAINDAFLRAGGMHFLAVSGFNVAVLAGAAWFVLRRLLRRGARSTALATCGLTLLFVLVTELNAPILRAALCVLAATGAALLKRPVCPLNWLALAAGGILLWNPAELFRAGFQLSFVQVFALLTVIQSVHAFVFARRGEEPAREARTFWGWFILLVARGAAGLAVVCICAWAIAIPLVLLHFGNFAPWGWLGTFLLTLPVTLVTIAGLLTITANLCAMLLGAWLAPVAAALAWLTQGLTAAMLAFVRWFEHFPGSLVQTSTPPAALVFATYAGLLLLWVLIRRTPRVVDQAPAGMDALNTPRRAHGSVARVGAGLAAAVALAGTWTAWIARPPPYTGLYAVQVLAVGNGSATLITTPNRRAAIFDVGTDTNSDAGEIAASALRVAGGTLDAVWISHPNFDHFSGLPTLLERFPTCGWRTSPYFFDSASVPAAESNRRQRAPRSARLAEDQVRELRGRVPSAARQALVAGERGELDGLTFEVLWPRAELRATSTANARAVVLRLTIRGYRILLTSDIERTALGALLEAQRTGAVELAAEVLVAPHHGAVLPQVTADFYAAVAPRVVVASTRTPRDKLVQLVAHVCPEARLLLTAETGAVVACIGPAGELRIETPCAKPELPRR